MPFSNSLLQPNIMRFTIFSLACLLAGPALAQANFNTEVPKDSVILQSTRDYAAARLGRPLKLASNQPNKALGLSASQADCSGNGYN